MATTTRPTSTTALDRPAFKVADLSLADFGRKEIRLAEQEMPGLMVIDEAIQGMVSKSSGRNESKRIGDLENPRPRGRIFDWGVKAAWIVAD